MPIKAISYTQQMSSFSSYPDTASTLPISKMFSFAGIIRELIWKVIYGRTARRRAPTESESNTNTLSVTYEYDDIEDTHDSEIQDHPTETRSVSQRLPTPISTPSETDSRCAALLRVANLSPYDQAICQMILAMGQTKQAQEHAFEAFNLFSRMAENDPLNAPLVRLADFSESYSARLRWLNDPRWFMGAHKEEGGQLGKHEDGITEAPVEYDGLIEEGDEKI
ncbi:hypothetical protein K490DRAFT_63583 [Saccharata proteae CBS 121410]|uniref:Uncharacterized protein n=1 Tax=Saccharata proteae CBS 121410 TaxID=1314787 RepID=A0A6A5YCL9_9PEZI|nr:hypothetical protein K490DRAFT_63583 [Saccharata proteae CBS 121410]